MLELYLPYLIAVALGMDVGAEAAVVADAGEVAVAETSDAVKPVAQARAPEEQVANGRYLNALEVRPILTITKEQWAAISAGDGNDLLYFTNLLAWRCGLWEIRYGINGAPATEIWPMEQCHVDTASPGAFVDMVNFPPFVVYPENSIQSLRIEITYDDGTMDFVEVPRTRIVLP